jgi:hypothetical protein
MNEPGQDVEVQLEGAHLENTFTFSASIAMAQILLNNILFKNYVKADWTTWFIKTTTWLANGNDKAFVTEASSGPLDFAALFNFERSRTFLLEYLNPEPLFLFLVSLDRIDPSPSFICSKQTCDHEALKDLS